MDFSIIILILGAGVLLIGQLIVLVCAFRESVWWGLSVFFLPLANIIFMIRHWAESKIGTMISLVGIFGVAAGCAMALNNPTIRAFVQAAQGGDPKAFMDTMGVQAPTVDDMLGQARAEVARLEVEVATASADVDRQYKLLNSVKATLNEKDAASVENFNARVAAYKQRNESAAAMKAELEMSRKTITQLLDQRAATAPTGIPGGGAQKVVMYTTSTCPACTMAKKFCQQRGIPYEEKNVEQSPAAYSEFRKLGGDGVPLILVGSEKMSGFNPNRLEQLLGRSGSGSFN
jgi:glutaredoxin